MNEHIIGKRVAEAELSRNIVQAPEILVSSFRDAAHAIDATTPNFTSFYPKFVEACQASVQLAPASDFGKQKNTSHDWVDYMFDEAGISALYARICRKPRDENRIMGGVLLRHLGIQSSSWRTGLPIWRERLS